MLPVNSGGHTAYQNFVTENLRKYYPNPNALARSTWDIIERFWNLDLSYTDELLADKYSKFGPFHEHLLVCSVLTCYRLILRFLL